MADFLILLVIAGICGGIGQALAGYSGGGCLVSIVLGLTEFFAIQVGGRAFPVLCSIICRLSRAE